MPCPYCGSQHPREVSASAAKGQPMVEVCPLAPPIGDTLDGKYAITREVRRTSTGVIYEASERDRDRRVAVKTLLEATSKDGQLVARFRREARAAGALGDPRIPRVFDLGRTSQGLLYLVTELLEGESLAALLARTPRLAVPLALNLMSQVLSGLAAAHKAGLVHRDLNPESIFIPNGKGQPEFVKILDFGVGRIVPVPGPRPGAAKLPGNTTGMLFGTPLYTSPELARGLNTAADHRTDIYSAGAILYQMLCGSPPFHGDDVAQLLRDIVEGTYARPTTLRPDIPAAVESAIVRALEREPRKRFATAAAMRAELSAGGVALTPTPAPPKIPPAPVASVSSTTVAGPAQGPLSAPPPDTGTRPPPVAAVPPPVRHDSALRQVATPASPSPAPPPGPPEPSARPVAVARDRGARTQALVRAHRRIPRWALIAGGLALVVALVLIFRPRRPSPPPAVAPPPPPEVVQRFFLRISPKDATVTLDNVPVSVRELPLDSGPPQAHVLKVAAAGYVSRSLTFTATAGMELIVRLGHTLPAPAPSDPPPLPAELASDELETAYPALEIEQAFATLGRYATCLTVLPRLTDEAKRAAGAPLAGAELALCRSLAESAAREARFPSLYPAAQAYVTAAGKGEKAETLARMGARFLAEYLAERSLWQWQELARIGEDEGRKAAWHMRRVALAAHAWVRAGGSGPANRGIVEMRASKLTASLQALEDYVRGEPRGLGGIRGADDFLRAARELVASARTGKRANDGASFTACAKLLTSFDALVLD